MYEVTIRISDLVLEKLTREQFEQFRDVQFLDEAAKLLGFHQMPHMIKHWCDYPNCDKVFIVYTKEVVKPSLFEHALPYTAEVL
jgi:sulfur relay (sulfurtransferase) DsrF/TusC family protein